MINYLNQLCGIDLRKINLLTLVNIRDVFFVRYFTILHVLDGQMKRMSISLFLKSPLATAPTINKIDNVFERENTSQHNQINVVKETESLPNASSPPATTEKDGNKDQHSNTETPNTTGDSSRACRLSTRKQTLARREGNA